MDSDEKKEEKVRKEKGKGKKKASYNTRWNTKITAMEANIASSLQKVQGKSL